jgi:hypothetical protein
MCREWTPTLLSELPLWELEFWWTPKSLECDFKGQSSLDWRVSYIIRKLLECKCLNGLTRPIWGTQNINYGQKKGRESNCQFDSWPLQVNNCLDLLMQMGCHIFLEFFWWGLQLYFGPHFNQRSTQKNYLFPKLKQSQFWEF